MLTKKNTKLNIYIAGPMRGHTNLNRDAFHKAERQLDTKKVYNVFNPAKWDENLGVGVEDLYEQDELRTAIRRDLNAICDCEAIYMLNGWEHSSGARLEHMLASFLGLMVLYE